MHICWELIKDIDGGEMATTGDAEDFVTCGVCLNEYDEGNRKPKFLCCFHTVCLDCIRNILVHSDGKIFITCPFCRTINCDLRKDTKEKWVLPNNNHALHILKQKKQIAQLTSIIEIPPMHSKNVDAFFNSLEELLKLKDAGTTKLALAIQERKKIQEQLDLIMKSIESAREEVQKLQDENNVCLGEMISILETNVKKTEETHHRDDSKRSLVLSEFKSLFDGSTAEDTTETLKLKFEKSVEVCEQKLCEARAMASGYERQSKIKIAVYLFDEYDHPIQTLPLFHEGFRLQAPSLISGFQQDLLFLSHVVFSLLRKQKIPLKNEEPLSGSSKLTSLPPTISSSDKSKFTMGNLSSKFILRLFQSGRSKGEIHIRPAPTFHPAFVQKLGDFCYKTPKKFSTFIYKALSDVFVLFSMTHLQFQPEVSSMIGDGSNESNSNNPLFRYTANDIDEVGITQVQTSAGKVIGWSFVFVLKEYENLKKNLHEKVSDNELFGRVIHRSMLGSMTELSKIKKSERVDYSMTLESQ